MTSTDIQKKIDALVLERKQIYDSVKDMTVSANKTDIAMGQMTTLATEINGLKKKLALAKKEEGAEEFIQKKKDFLNK